MRRVELITGRMGKGKTTLGFHLAKERHRGKGVFVFDTAGNFSIGESVNDFHSMMRAIDREPAVIVFQPRDVEQGFREFSQAVWTTRRQAVLVDEASFLEHANYLNPDLDALVRLGRRQEISVITTQHRIAEVSGLLRTVVTDYYFFQTKHPRELERIEEIANEAVSEQVSSLGDHEYLHWEVESESFEVVRDPRTWKEKIFQETEEREVPVHA
jgi:hypothetical protein